MRLGRTDKNADWQICIADGPQMSAFKANKLKGYRQSYLEPRWKKLG
jgi:hypothetical protein